MADESQAGNNRLKKRPTDPWLRDQWNKEFGAGKGDRRRPEDKTLYDEGYARIFGRCSMHSGYDASFKPTSDCIVCRRLWREAELRRASEGDTGAEGGSVGGGRGELAQGSEPHVAEVVPPTEPEGRT